MKKKTNMELQNDIARMESINDFLMTDLENVNELLKSAGFEAGTMDLKEAAEELIVLEAEY